jgi:putative membrane-bound dehydrogenase-like protein
MIDFKPGIFQKRSYVFFLFTLFFYACNSGSDTKIDNNTTDSLTEEQKRLPENALKGLVTFEGLEVRTMATEPMLKNPTNIDVDERGRVWVTEAYNYRPGINGNPTNALGDRIMILEDNNGDGQMDTAKVFYQGPELNAPLGIHVLYNKVIVSQSPYIWVFYDDNGDDKADRKEILFQGIGGEQHDHGVHAFTFGPDGKFYFNFGNEGKQLKDKNGKPVLDQDGDPIDTKKYKQGMVFRCDTNGTNVECLASNFRNPYEVAVDSYGLLWQSDNDDDGNRSTRINYLMDYGNYGFTDEVTGAGWRANRTNIEDSIPLRHWHQSDPGSIPNLLQTFAGSPTGIIVYEGSLLPKDFYGQMIHCDAGNNVVRAYPVQKNGAGYTATITNIVRGEKDQWFRPADVCAAPDGSLIVADWYDPGVGGHAAGDQAKGRIYRIAPPNTSYNIPKQDYSSVQGAITALQNPNLSVRYHAWNVLQEMGNTAVAELEKLWNNTSADPRMRARAFWVLAKMKGADANKYIQQAIKEANPDLRITGLRAAREINSDVPGVIRALANDKDPQVRRECALALHHNKAPEAASLWVTLAKHYDGKDRWYLEALGIGADGQWDNFFAAYKAQVTDPLQSEASKNIVWRARTDAALPYLSTLALAPQAASNDQLKYFRAFDFHEGPLKSKLLLQMIEKNTTNDTTLNKLVLYTLDVQTVKKSSVAQSALKNVLQSVYGTDEFNDLVGRYEVKTQNENLLKMALSRSQQQVGKNAAGLLLKLGGSALAWKVINGKDSVQQDSLLIALANVGSKSSVDFLQTLALSNKYPMSLRKNAAQKIGKSWMGEERVLEILKAKKVPGDLIPDVVASVSGAWRGSIRTEAASYLPNAEKNTAAKLAPSLQELLAVKTNVEEGKKVFGNACMICHQAGNTGYDFGPKLTEIGSKLPKEGLLEAIVHPSKGISFGYEGWQLKMKDGSTFSGIIASKTETDIILKLPGGATKEIKTADIETMSQMKESMMPEGLYQNMSKEDLANLMEYLSGLKKK